MLHILQLSRHCAIWWRSDKRSEFHYNYNPNACDDDENVNGDEGDDNDGDDNYDNYDDNGDYESTCKNDDFNNNNNTNNNNNE